MKVDEISLEELHLALIQVAHQLIVEEGLMIRSLVKSRGQSRMKGVNGVISVPRFAKDQVVEFFGGRGKVKSHHYESDSWVYHVEMAMGTEPDFGRVGCETMIILPESDVGSSTK